MLLLRMIKFLIYALFAIHTITGLNDTVGPVTGPSGLKKYTYDFQKNNMTCQHGCESIKINEVQCTSDKKPSAKNVLWSCVVRRPKTDAFVIDTAIVKCSEGPGTGQDQGCELRYTLKPAPVPGPDSSIAYLSIFIPFVGILLYRVSIAYIKIRAERAPMGLETPQGAPERGRTALRAPERGTKDPESLEQIHFDSPKTFEFIIKSLGPLGRLGLIGRKGSQI
jgi:hypothetical protein